MPRILTADEAGACYGVERALAMAEEAVSNAEGPVHTLGPLIHNPRVVADLESAGITVVRTPAEAAGETLLLRTHGVTPEVEREAREVCRHVLDATCPFVKKVHVAAERLSREGYQVVVVGEAGHPEVEATVAHAAGAVVVDSAAEARSLGLHGKVGVVVQTTQSHARLMEVVGELLRLRRRGTRFRPTICEATSGHQRACDELRGVRWTSWVRGIGGRTPSNQTRLAESPQGAALSIVNHVWECPDELDPPPVVPVRGAIGHPTAWRPRHLVPQIAAARSTITEWSARISHRQSSRAT